MGKVTVFVPDGCECKVHQLAAELMAAQPLDRPNLRWLKARGYSWEMHDYASFEPANDGWPAIAFEVTSAQLYEMDDAEIETLLEATLAHHPEFQEFRGCFDRGEVDAWLEQHPPDRYGYPYTVYI